MGKVSVNLTEWAARWGVPFAALEDLRRRMGAEPTDPSGQGAPETEAGAQTAVRLEATRKGLRLFRNNVGATYTADGAFLRYGLANDSVAMNKRIKSADLIGIRPVVITPGLVGLTLGQFVAREVKRPGWRYSGTPREIAQLRFLELVLSLGGDAAFCTGEGSL